jgi:hypothetical protein
VMVDVTVVLRKFIDMESLTFLMAIKIAWRPVPQEKSEPLGFPIAIGTFQACFPNPPYNSNTLRVCLPNRSSPTGRLSTTTLAECVHRYKVFPNRMVCGHKPWKGKSFIAHFDTNTLLVKIPTIAKNLPIGSLLFLVSRKVWSE